MEGSLRPAKKRRVELKGMGPPWPLPEGRGPCLEYEEIREKFIDWFSGRVSKEYFESVLRYLDRNLDGRICDRRQIDEILKRASSRKYMVVGIRDLLKFCEEHEVLPYWKISELRRGLKCVKSGVDLYVPSDEQVRECLKNCDRTEYSVPYKLLAYSGIRITECLKMLSSFEEKRLMISEDLGISKYPISWSRGSKRSYFAYMPLEFSLGIKRIKLREHGLKNYFRRRGLPLKYLRKWNYNFLIERGVPESVADFIQGRAPVSVGSMHYLAKVRQADIWYSRVSGEMVRAIEG